VLGKVRRQICKVVQSKLSRRGLKDSRMLNVRILVDDDAESGDEVLIRALSCHASLKPNRFWT
jgi:hypothetical protein